MLNLRLSLTDALCARAEPGQREYAMRDTRCLASPYGYSPAGHEAGLSARASAVKQSDGRWVRSRKYA